MAQSWAYVAYPQGASTPQVSQKPNVYHSNVSSKFVSAGWQERFDELWLALAETTEAKSSRLYQLKNLISEFCNAATLVTAQVLEDLKQPQEKRQTKPLQELGSNFYFANGILMDFCSDVGLGIYGGDDGAKKAATRHMTALQCLLDAKVNDLCLPLMCCVDLYGNRALCSAWIPNISEDAMVYGWKSEAKEFVSVSQEFNGKIEQVCRTLRLRAHNTISASGSTSTIYGPADIHGYVTKSGDTKKYYLLNFERLMPAIFSNEKRSSVHVLVFPKDGSDIIEADVTTVGISAFLKRHGLLDFVQSATARGIMYFSPSDDQINARASHFVQCEVRGTVAILQNTGSRFFQLHRPEHIKMLSDEYAAHDEVLGSYRRCAFLSHSSDTMTGFGWCAGCFNPNVFCSHGAAVLHAAADGVHRKMIERLLLLTTRIEKREVAITTSGNLIDVVHQHGIHLQLLGSLWYAMNVHFIKELLKIELISRCVRHHLRSEQRQAMQSENGIKLVTLNILNAVMGNGIDADKFWNIQLPKLLQYFWYERRYSPGLLEIHPQIPELPRPTDKSRLFLRILQLCGVKITEDSRVRVFNNTYDHDLPFTSSDLIDCEPQVKAPNFSTQLETLTGALAIETRGANTHRERYHELVLKAFGPHHPYSIISFVKLSLELSGRHLPDDATAMARKALESCLAFYGPFSHHEAVVLTALGDIAQASTRNSEALKQYRAALRVAFVLFGDEHALVGKLCSRIGRLEIKLGDKKLGLQCLGRGYQIYKQLFGDLCDYLTPTVTMGKSEEISSVLNQLLRATRDAAAGGLPASDEVIEIKQNTVVGLEAGKALAPSAICERITKSIRDLEEVEGLERGYLLENDVKVNSNEVPIETTADPMSADKFVSSEWEEGLWPLTLIAADVHRLFLHSASPVTCSLELIEEAEEPLPTASSTPQPFVSSIVGAWNRYCITICIVRAGKYSLNVNRTETEKKEQPAGSAPPGRQLVAPLTVLPSAPVGSRSSIRLTQEGDTATQAILKLTLRDPYGNFFCYVPQGPLVSMHRFYQFYAPEMHKKGFELRFDTRIACNRPEMVQSEYTCFVAASVFPTLAAGVEYGFHLQMKANYRIEICEYLSNVIYFVGAAPETMCKASVGAHNQALAAICNHCHMKRNQNMKCLLCSSTIASVTLRIPARYCHSCSLSSAKKCALCKMHMHTTSQCLYVCKSCSMVPRCVGMKRSVPGPPPKGTS